MSSSAATSVNYILRRLRETQFLELIHELENLKLYMLCLDNWNSSSFGRDSSFGFLKESHIEAKFEEVVEILNWDYPEYPIEAKVKDSFLPQVSELLEKIQQCKPKIKEDCLNFLDCPFQCNFSSDKLRKFIMCISTFLHNPLFLKDEMIPDVKVKIKSLQDTLEFFKQVSEFTAVWCSHEDVKDFEIHFQAWASRAACLFLLFWVQDVKNENIASRMEVILSDLKKKLGPSTLEVTRVSFAVLLKSSESTAENRFTALKFILNFVEILKDNLQVDPEKDDIQMFFIDLIFLISFLMDQRKTKKSAEEELILIRIDGVFQEAIYLIGSLISGETKKGTAEESNFLLHNFLEKANASKAEVRKFYAYLFPDPSSFNFPRINLLRFIDSVLENWKGPCFYFPKHQIMILHEELMSLRESYLTHFSILELQNKHMDIKYLWTQTVNVVYNAKRVVDSIHMKKFLWHDILCLSDVIGEIKFIKGEMKRIKDQHIYDIHALNSPRSPNLLLPLQANISTVDKIVGFNDEVQKILGRLTSGSPELDIISIVGMPGVGKTTLAKKVYSDSSVQLQFNKLAWCTVSQTINSQRMLFDIASHLNVCDYYELSKLGEEDLAHRIYKSLKGRRYLIVLDDIWDVSAWDALKMSFPEDNNGSRMIFTSRIQKVVSEAKSGCSPFPLNPLPEEESWRLLEMKLFDQGSCPSNFIDVGKQMATQCKGLPLAVVLIAGLLRENIQSLDWWKQVGENLDSLIAKEGCTGILELSYEHLPEYLKPCFLYFGSFPEDKDIRVKQLTQLWISEDFVQKQEMKSLEAVAEEYLTDLVGRSLVIASKRSSTGGIKSCRVHDLLHDFCLAKGEEENLFKVVHRDEVSSLPIPMNAKYAYRMCISEPECWISLLKQMGPPAPFVHSLHSFYRSKLFPESSYLYIICCVIDHFKFLQVLNLSSYPPLDGFPDEITELSLLRSLVMRGKFQDIPQTIKRLENLEILGLHNWIWLDKFTLPVDTWEIHKLREVRLHQALMPLDFSDDTPPLENVQVFSGIVLHGKMSEMFLRKIPNVKTLKFQFQARNGYIDSDQIPKLDFLSHLESLHVSFPVVYVGKFRRCPFQFPSSLKKLNFENLKLPWSEISTISKLHNLEVLKLSGIEGKTWNVEDDEFLKLKFLKLQWLRVKKWNASDESFPCLESLVLEGFFNLEEIPSRFGSILSLNMIQVKNCRSTLNSSVREIHEDQINLGNEHLKVLISGVMEESSSDSDSDSS